MWPLKSQEHKPPILLCINQEIPAVSRYRASKAEIELEEVERAKKLMQRTYSNETEFFPSHKSYMDSDFNPLKKHEFPKDKYLTKIFLQAKSEGHSQERLV